MTKFVDKFIYNFITIFHKFKKVEQKGTIDPVNRYKYVIKNDPNQSFLKENHNVWSSNYIGWD